MSSDDDCVSGGEARAVAVVRHKKPKGGNTPLGASSAGSDDEGSWEDPPPPVKRDCSSSSSDEGVDDDEDEGGERRKSKRRKPAPKFYIEDITESLARVIDDGVTEKSRERLDDLLARCAEMVTIRRRETALKRRQFQSYLHVFCYVMDRDEGVVGFFVNTKKSGKEIEATMGKRTITMKPVFVVHLGMKNDPVGLKLIKDIKATRNLYKYADTPNRFKHVKVKFMKDVLRRQMKMCDDMDKKVVWENVTDVGNYIKVSTS